jgi:hypothetical protein
MTTPNKKFIQDHLEQLVGERNPFSTPETLHATADYVETQLQCYGLEISREEVPFDDQTFHNVFGFLKGTDPSGALFILGAHFDSVEDSPGADDNASAVASMLEAARCLANRPVKTSLLFAGFTLEEYGFIGSRQVAERFHKKGEDLLGMISLEMLGYRTRDPDSQKYPPYVDASRYPDAGDFIAVVGNEPSQGLTWQLAETLKRAKPDLGVEQLVLPGTGEMFHDVRLSDHSPFWENGFRAVMVTDTAFFRNPHYHQPSDSLDTLDVDFIRDITAGLVEYLADPKV